jgi:gliding motility-associated protein GldE
LDETDIDSVAGFAFLITDALMIPFSLPIIIGLLAVIILLACSAVISASEIAFFSLSPTQLKNIKAKKGSASELIISLLESPKYLLSTILIANNFVNVSIVILSTFITNNLFDLGPNPVLAFIIQVIVVTSLILILGEIMPKIYSAFNPVKVATIMARSINTMIVIFYPLSWFLVNSTVIVDKRLVKKGTQLSMSELSEAIELTSDKNTPDDERKILQGIVKFSDTEAKEIMKSRIDITAVDISTSYHPLLKIILENGYSRIPAYQDGFDKIAGVLYVKDLLPHLDKPDDFDWQALLRPAFFVPENKKINDLLVEFQKLKIHLAIVVDEYGGTSGIVTLEDIIEEIVGEISDEFDTEEDEINFTKIDDNNYIFEGKTLLNDFYRILEIDDTIFDDVKGDSETLAGVILELEGKIPKINERTKFQNFEFKIKKVSNRRIEQILVKILNN